MRPRDVTGAPADKTTAPPGAENAGYAGRLEPRREGMQTALTDYLIARGERRRRRALGRVTGRREAGTSIAVRPDR